MIFLGFILKKKTKESLSHFGKILSELGKELWVDSGIEAENASIF
jgi:hypothetical protein